MKKYMPVLFAVFSLTLFITLLGFNANVASADYTPGCTSDLQIYSLTTGQICNTVSLTQNLQIGSRGSEVTILQRFLKFYGYFFGIADGRYGRITARAVGDFQEDVGFPRTERVDTSTRAKINNAIAAGNLFDTNDDDTTNLPAGCTSTIGYSPTTGVKCDSGSSSFPPGCTSNSGYSVTTGRPCSDGSNFPPGCTSSTGFSSTTGQPCGSTPTPCPAGTTAVGMTNSIPGTYICSPNPSRTNNPVISGVSGPVTLDVNQTGTWTIKASAPNGGNLSYSVIWGDETEKSSEYNRLEQSATFTHSYRTAGIYTPTFTVTSENTIRCITTPCPSNGGSAQTSLSVKVREVKDVASNSEQVKCVFEGATTEQRCYTATHQTSRYYNRGCSGVESCVVDLKVYEKGENLTWKSSCGGYADTTIDGVSEYARFKCTNDTPSITVLSPNGGETYTKGQVITIQWASQYIPPNATMNIYLVNSLSGDNSPTDVVANNLNPNISQSYSWDTALPTGTNSTISGVIPTYLSPGQYKVDLQVSWPVPVTSDNQKGGLSIRDLSNNYFTITAPTPVAQCTDSDGGININVAGLTDGRVNGIGSYFNDASVGSNGGVCSGTSCTSVAEGYCTADKKVTNYLYRCPSGYSINGACASTTTQPSITSLSKNSGPVGTSVKIYGKNLTNTSSNGSSNYVWFNGYSFEATSSSPDGVSVTFIVPSTLATGTYQVSVKTSLSLPGSNSLPFTITDSTTTERFIRDFTSYVSSGEHVKDIYWNASANVDAVISVSCPGSSGAEYITVSLGNTSRQVLCTTSTSKTVIANFSDAPGGYTTISKTSGNSVTVNATLSIYSVGTSSSSSPLATRTINVSLIPPSVNPPTAPAPTATFTVSGQESYTYTSGQTNQINWSSTNADTFSSSYTVTGPSVCGGGGAWVANTANGESRTYLSSVYVGCVWTITYTAKNSQTGQSASDTIIVRVVPQETIKTGSSLSANAISTTTNEAAEMFIPKSFYFTQFLEEGSYGNEVAELQKFLNSKGYDAGKVDGVFGVKVKEAFLKFQTANGLKADGILGYEVRSFLNK